MLNIRLIQSQPRERIPHFYGLCDLSLVPLKNDAVFATVIPSKIFECMAMNLPMLVAMPAGETTEIVRETKAGWVVPPEDPGAIAKAIERLADEPDSIHEMAMYASEAATQFSRVRQAEHMMKVLQDAAGPKFRGSAQ
jgi:glycosyltransferase involved in cell wall biosynthesis